MPYFSGCKDPQRLLRRCHQLLKATFGVDRPAARIYLCGGGPSFGNFTDNFTRPAGSPSARSGLPVLLQVTSSVRYLFGSHSLTA